MTTARLTGRVAPILPSRDLPATIEFYSRLGFRTAARYPDEGYLILIRDDVELHFFHHPAMDPGSDAHAVYIRLDTDPSPVQREWRESGIGADPTAVPRLLDVVATDYGMHEFALVDPDGNLLRIGGAQTAP